MTTVYLVSCVSKKLPSPAPARDLYTSDWFRKARQYVEATGQPWFILSAEHGLLHPDTVIAPYEKTLNTMRVAARREWSNRVKNQLASQLPAADRIVVLAGQRYREFLMDYLDSAVPQVDIPLDGLRIGEQLRWLKAHLHGEQGS